MNTPNRKNGSGEAPGVSGSSGARRLAHETLARLTEGTAARPEALPFAESVTLHLSHPPGGPGTAQAERDAADRVLRLLDASRPPPGGADWLAADAPLMASVFQNIDLLVAHGSPAADAVALRVMQALERVEPFP